MPQRILVVTVHGIRTFGQWQERLETITKAAANADDEVVFKHKHYGYFSVLSFLNPFARNAEAKRFSLELAELLAVHEERPFDRICLVGHSFGTHIIAHALRHLPSEISRKIETVIFGGSVLSSHYPWNELLGTRVVRLVNDCGTRDWILPLNAILPFGSGVAGRNGFDGIMDDQYCNRYFEFGHSGYFYRSRKQADPSDDNWYLKRFWAPLLLRQSPVEACDERSSGALAGLTTGFVARTERLKWLPPSIVIAALIGLVLFIYSLYLTAETQRQEAVRQRNEATRQTMIAQRSQSEALAQIAKQDLAEGNAENAMAASLAGLPTKLSAPNRPLVPDLVDTLDVAVSSPSPKRLFPVPTDEFAVDKSGKRIGLGLIDGEIQIWDVATGRQLGTLPGHQPKRLQSLEFSDDGRKLVSTGVDDYVRVWDVDGLRQLSSFKYEDQTVLREAHFAAGDSRIFVLSNDGIVALLDAASGNLIQKWQAHTGSPENLARFLSSVLAAAMSPDGEYYVTGGLDSLIKIWSARTASLYKSILAAEVIYRLQMSPKGGIFASVDGRNDLTIWSLPDGGQQGSPIHFQGLALWLIVAPDESKIAISVDKDKTYIVDVATGQSTPLPSQSGTITSFAFNPGGSSFVTASNATSDISAWRTADLSLQTVLHFGDLPQQMLQFVSDGDLLARTSDAVTVWGKDDLADGRTRLVADSPVLSAAAPPFINSSETLVAARLAALPAGAVWDIKNIDQPPKLLIGHREPLMQLRFAGHGTELISASADYTAILWDAKSGVIKQRFIGHEAEVQSAILINDDTRLLTSSRDGTARVWDTASGKQLARMDGKAAFIDVVTSPDDAFAVGVDDESNILVWRTSDGVRVQKIVTPSAVGPFAVTPAADNLIVSLQSGTIIVYAMSNGAEIKRLSAHAAQLTYISFSKNGKRMLTSSIDGLTAVWNLETLSLIATFQTGTKGIWGGELDDDGERALTGADDGTILIWRPDTGVIIRRLELPDLDPSSYSVKWSKDRMIILGSHGQGQEVDFRTVSRTFAQGNDAARAAQMMLDYASVVAALPLADSASGHSIEGAEDIDDCDRLAAQPFDPARKADGIVAEKVDKPAAESACRKAVGRAPAEPRFQYQLGRVLYLEKRDPEAIAAFEKAAARQYAMAKVALYEAYDENRAGDRSADDMLRLLREALDQGAGIAGYRLADSYWSGKRVTADRDQALQLYQRSAAALNYPYAQDKLSELYEAGAIVPRDDQRALSYQIQAAELFERLGLDSHAEILRRSSLARRMDAATVVAAHDDAMSDLQKARAK